jgi:group I intron endonuclease
MIGIYKITSPDNKVYIGQSVDIQNRWNQYQKYYAENQPKLKASFFKHGIDNHKFEIIHECTLDEINGLEMFYINSYKSIDQLNANIGTDKIKKTKILNTNKEFDIIKRATKQKIKTRYYSRKLMNKQVIEYKELLSTIFTNKNPNSYLTATEIKLLIFKIKPEAQINSIVFFGIALKDFFGHSVSRRVNNKILKRYSVSLL